MMRRPTPFARALGIALLATAAAVMPVAAAGSLTVDPPSGSPGQTLTAIGSGFPAGQLITLRWDGVILPETGSSGDNGSFEIGFAIPASAAVGGHELRACVRSDCSLAPPFTVAVVVAPSVGPSPSPNPTAAASESPPSSSTPGPSTPPESTPPSTDPAASSSPGASASADASSSPAVEPSDSGGLVGPTVIPTVVPTALPGDPDAPGTLKTRFVWLALVVGGLGLALVLLALVRSRNDVRTVKSRSGHPLDDTSNETRLRGSVGPSAKTPKLFEAAAKGTHTPPAGDDSTAPSVSDIVITKSLDDADPTLVSDTSPGTDAKPDAKPDAEPDAEPEADAPADADASDDVKLKGKKIGEN